MSVLSIGSLSEALSKVKDLGRQTEEVEVGEITFRLRCLNTTENRKKNDFLAAVAEEWDSRDSMVMSSTYEFFSAQKIETLAWAIIGINGAGFENVDLSGVKFLETEEMLENGARKLIEKHVFMRQLLEDMGNAAVDVLHEKYIDLLTRSEEEAREKVSFRNLEDELAAVELRRQELLKALGKIEEVDTNVVTEEGSKGVPEDVDVGALRDHFRAPLTEDAARERYQQQLEAANQRRGTSPDHEKSPDHENPPTQAPVDDAFEAGGATFIRLDDPEIPYSDEEVEYLEEQERLYQMRNGDTPPEDAFMERPQTNQTQAEETAALMNKRRRQPLNEAPIQVQSGALPESQSGGRKFVRKSEIDPTGLELAEGQDPEQVEHLGRAPFDQQAPKIDPKPQGHVNPNFRPNKK